MKYLLANLGANLLAIVCVCVAGYMAINKINGWGWFLFIGLCCACSVNFKDSK